MAVLQNSLQVKQECKEEDDCTNSSYQIEKIFIKQEFNDQDYKPAIFPVLHSEVKVKGEPNIFNLCEDNEHTVENSKTDKQNALNDLNDVESLEPYQVEDIVVEPSLSFIIDSTNEIPKRNCKQKKRKRTIFSENNSSEIIMNKSSQYYVYNYFQKYIQIEKVPDKEECISCIRSNTKLKRNKLSWKCIKRFVIQAIEERLNYKIKNNPLFYDLK